MRIETVQVIITHAVRCPGVVAQLDNSGITGQDFANKPYHYLGPIWDQAARYYREQNTTPSKFILEQMVSQSLAGWTLPEGDWWAMRRFLDTAYSFTQEELSPSYVLTPGGILQQFIDEIRILPMMQQMALELDSGKRDELYQQSMEVRSATRVASLQYVDLLDPAVASVKTGTSTVEPTGVDYMDYLAKGMRKTAFVGLLAGSGGGKTLTGIQWAMEQASRGIHTAYLSYEQEVAGDLAERVFTYLGGITRDEASVGYDNYAPEVKARIAAAREHIDKYWRIYPMAGDVYNQGRGGVPEIEAMIDMMRTAQKFPVRNIVIDWFRPMMLKWQNVHKLFKAKDMREQMLNALARLAQVRDSKNVRILLLHQIAPHIYEKMGFESVPSWTSAEDCKAFAEDMDACICYGKPDPITGVMWATYAKCRWHGPVPLQRMVKLDGARGKITDAHNLYTFDPEGARTGGPAFKPVNGK